MNPASDHDAVRRVAAALAAADVDVQPLVEDAWEDARDEVRATLRRLMVAELLQRCADELDPPARSPAPARTSGPARTPRRARAQEPATKGVYLFGVTPAARALPDVDMPALPDAGDLRLVSASGLAAVVCDVDLATFEVLRDPATDGLDTLADLARTHDAILATLAGDGTILPLRLGTVLPDDDAIAAVLAASADRLRAELDRVAGHSEWAVTVHLLAAPDAAARDVSGTSAAAPTGRGYLEARRTALDARRRRRAERDHLADSIHTALAACAADATRVGSRPFEDVAPPLLHGVYLLADGARDRFDATVAALRRDHADAVLDVSGPWPPYHFTSVDLADGGAHHGAAHGTAGR